MEPLAEGELLAFFSGKGFLLLRLTKFETLSAAGMIVVGARTVRSQFPGGGTRQRYSCAVSLHSVQVMPFITGSVMIHYEQEACFWGIGRAAGNVGIAEKTSAPWRFQCTR